MDHQTPDSAGTGTAYLTGVKTNMGTIGINAHARRGDCTSSIGTHLTSILDWSHDKGAEFKRLSSQPAGERDRLRPWRWFEDVPVLEFMYLVFKKERKRFLLNL